MNSESERCGWFLKMSNEYNKTSHLFDYSIIDTDQIARACMFIFLNKTCFNGLYRVNSKNERGSAFGKYKSPNICDEINIREVHTALQHVTLLDMDFESLAFDSGNDTFIYLDLPYKPINGDSNFTEYSMSKFNYSDQIRLACMIKRYARSDAKIFFSNSDDLFFENTYHEFNISKVSARRAVNSNSAGRHEINELVIRNFI